MAKTVSVNEYTYSLIAALSGKLTATVKKPVSLGMTIHMAVLAFEVLLVQPRSDEQLKKLLEGVSSPEKFDETWDLLYKMITKGKS